ncbi:phosphoserine phosphatase [Xylona heveae TC161]|uniref:phosphoserine phosphatase n=1 Tax=Xylona heveae (strain CBS 132557 / TC161) TaxID=1328760 RepID=A0A164ZN59_XYLHT|nr:phosphoserine phosphatase [Xylona heveae TC161]KZF19300.1 phosphoserine phosphatase [Xylona heveae TC161]
MAADGNIDKATRAERPMLRHSSLSGGSILQDHQQYRRPFSDLVNDRLDEHQLRGATPGSESSSEPDDDDYEQFQGNPAGASAARIKNAGIIHTMSHNNCQPGPNEGEKIVATIFYRADRVRQRHAQLSTETGAPSTSIEHLSLGAETSEPEPLDHLYGFYISQICLTYFLQILEELQHPYQRLTTSHRCLDSQVYPRVMEITFSPPPNPEYLTFEDLRKHESIWRFERQWNVEVVFQRESVFRKHKRLAVFDMDSTLIQQEVIDEIARAIGVEKQVSEITERAMNGELDFTASLNARVALLKGVPGDVFEKLKTVIRVTPGARELCLALKRLGFKMAVLSGGFTPLAEWLAGELGLDYAFANNLVACPETGKLTGELTGNIVDSHRKAFLLKQIAAENGIPLAQVMAVGDGANDLPMMKTAGLGVAFNAKPRVQFEAPTRVNSSSLQDILYLLGFSISEQQALLEVS